MYAYMKKGMTTMVSNKKYKKALEDCDRYRRRLDAKSSEAWFVLQDMMEYRDANIKLSEQVAEYKQKYLDEQQKRLELAELLERLEGSKNEEEEI
jgi:hypothetical protein